MPERDIGQDAGQDVLGLILHPAGAAGRAERALAGEGDEDALTAASARRAQETSAEQTAVEIPFQSSEHERRRCAVGVALLGVGERFEVVSDDPMQIALVGPPPLVSDGAR